MVVEIFYIRSRIVLISNKKSQKNMVIYFWYADCFIRGVAK